MPIRERIRCSRYGTDIASPLPVKPFEVRVDPHSGQRFVAVSSRGAALKDDPVLNKGTCFTSDEREQLGLLGLLPPAVQLPVDQVERAWGNYQRAGDDVHRYLFLAGLQDRNEHLFAQLVLQHLEEMVPVIYTPTVGKACEQYSHIYRRARGLYISAADRGRMAAVLRNSRVVSPRVIVATDNEAILGIGDQGVGGMPIAIGKLALYAIGAGVHPAECLPIDLDVGTDNPGLLSDPLYLGARHRRLRGDAYFDLLDEFVEAVATVFPSALVQWEDFANRNAFQVLDRYRRRVLSFNDDIQGTGAIVLAGIRAGLRRIGRPLSGTRVVFLGAGASGAGCALAVREALRGAGVGERDLARRFLCLDSQGLIVADRPGLSGAKQQIATDPDLVATWRREGDGTLRLPEVVRQFAPQVLVGVSGQPGAFTESIVRDMAASGPPIILALSNPTSRVEVTPAEVLAWTNGTAIVGTGSPFPPVTVDGIPRRIGQGNNVFIFPGVGLGATAVQARWLPDQAFSAAAEAVFRFTLATSDDAIFPPLAALREVSRQVAIAVGRDLVACGAAPALDDAEVERRVDAGMWTPDYLPYRPASAG
ncbi:MAG: NAD-dependent malic enzyme [Vicinamibacterales bacterium]